VQPSSEPRLHLGVGCHDGVVAIVITGGGFKVQRACPIAFSSHSAVLISLRNLLPIFEPVNLKRKIIKVLLIKMYCVLKK
jgi:hypothetical protein